MESMDHFHNFVFSIDGAMSFKRRRVYQRFTKLISNKPDVSYSEKTTCIKRKISLFQASVFLSEGQVQRKTIVSVD